MDNAIQDYNAVEAGVGVTHVAHVLYGSLDYNQIGGVFRGQVFLINPLPDKSRPEVGGIVPCDYFVSSNPLWLFGKHRGKTDLRGINYRQNYDMWMMQMFGQASQSAVDNNEELQSPIQLGVLPSCLKTITTEKLAQEGKLRQQPHSWVPDEVFTDLGLTQLRDTGIGCAIAATRFMGYEYTVLSGLLNLANDPRVAGLFRDWVERESPEWLYSFGQNTFGVPKYKHPSKMKSL